MDDCIHGRDVRNPCADCVREIRAIEDSGITVPGVPILWDPADGCAALQPSKPRRDARDLADEAGDCIEINELKGEQLRLYLVAWICDVAADGDLAAIVENREQAHADYERSLAETP